MQRFPATLAILLGVTGFARAQAPVTYSTIPVYAGAKAVAVEEDENTTAENPGFVRQNTRTHREMKARSVEVKAYEVAAPLEDVYAFYFAKLGGTEQWNDENTSDSNLKPGKASPTLLEKSEHEFDTPLIDPRDGNKEIPGSVKRATLKRSARKPFSGDSWLEHAGFHWSTREANGDVSDSFVTITDEGLANDWSSWSPRTRILISRITFIADE